MLSETASNLIPARAELALPDDIMNSKTLQREDDSGEAGPLDLWDCVLQHTLIPEFLAVDSEALPGRGPSGSARPLLCLAPAQ